MKDLAIWTISLLVAGFIIFCITDKSSEQELVINTTNDSIELLPEHPFYLMEEINDTVLFNTLVHYEFPEPEIITAQAVLETGNFKSKLCLEGNNLFGLYNSNKKQYFKFDSWISCVLSYKEVILNRYKDDESYMNFLKRIKYADDPQYYKKLKELSKKYETFRVN